MTATEPIAETIRPQKQAARRHYGSHQYFTKRAWNVIAAYVAHFTEPGDLVLDPFGGSGVVAVEAAIAGRRAVHVDLSPFANFLARAVAFAPVDLGRLERGFRDIERRARPAIEELERAPEEAFAASGPPDWYPRGVRLPRNADVPLVEDLFTRRQLFALARLRAAIEEATAGEGDPALRHLLLYCFSATLYKCNRTWLSARGRLASRGGSAIFSIFRYKVARSPVELPVWEQFDLRFRRLLACKAETNELLPRDPALAPRIVDGSATDLVPRVVAPESVDYVLTDPPYGGHIAYLDLATMFCAWLGLPLPDPACARLEAIEGGDLRHGRAAYLARIADAAREIGRALRPGAFASVVFAHRDLSLWEALVAVFEDAGLALRNAVPQPVSVVWSMHKKKNPGSALAGEMILNFRKGGSRCHAPRPSSREVAARAREELLAFQAPGPPSGGPQPAKPAAAREGARGASSS